jgi:hypothetical protein
MNMEGILTQQDLTASSQLLDQLFEEVAAQESHLSGRTMYRGAESIQPGSAAEALQRLRKTEVTFGSPYHRLVRLTPEGFSQCGLELSYFQKQEMSRYDFYYMVLPVSMQPGRGVQFTRFECKLDFGPKGEKEPLVHRIFPQSQWLTVLQLGRSMDLGLDGNLEWSAGIDQAALPGETALDNLPIPIKGKITGKNQLKAFVVLPEYVYELGRTEIAATGEGNSFCFWRIDKPDLRKAQTVRLGIVFKVPQGIGTIGLNGVAAVEPSFQWLTSNLGDMFDMLSENLKRLLGLNKDERSGKDRLPRGCFGEWTITLPV